MKGKTIKKLVAAAVIGALYAALTIALSFISYGPIQFRVSEALCVLPFFFPVSAWGLFCGCVIANLLSPAGLPDIIFGSLATLGAVMCVTVLGGRYRRDGSEGLRRCLAVCAMPVIFNAPVVGAVNAFSLTPAGAAFWTNFALIGLEVALGETAVMFLLGLPLMRLIMKNDTLRRLVADLK